MALEIPETRSFSYTPREGERVIEQDVTAAGPMAGLNSPLHGGSPSRDACNGCTDCCHLPEISVTDEEATRLLRLYEDFDRPHGTLVIRADPDYPGWRIMQGPCVFRSHGSPAGAGGCRIYFDRPAGCAIFTCRLRLALQREL